MNKIDEKGKLFTERVRKEGIEVLIVTERGQIRGHVHLMPGERVKDLLNSDEQFIAVTEATLEKREGAVPQHVGFMALNKQFIISVTFTSENTRGLLEDEYYVHQSVKTVIGET